MWQSTGHNGKIPFLPGHHLNLPLNHIYTPSWLLKPWHFGKFGY